MLDLWEPFGVVELWEETGCGAEEEEEEGEESGGGKWG